MASKLEQSSKKSLLKKIRTQTAANTAEKAKLNALFDSIGEGVIATDDKGRIERVNRAAIDILGYSKKELIGEWFQDIVSFCYEDGTKFEKDERPIYKTLLTGEITTANGYTRTKQGELIAIAATASPILYRKRPVGALGIFRSIKKEIEADRLKSEFMSLASHQLRTPLSAINTYAFLLKEGYAGDLNENQKSFLEVVLSASKRMNQLISSLLNIIRIEGGKMSISSQPADLSKLLKKSIREFEPQLRKKGLSLSVKIDKEIGTVDTDHLIVGEIFSNLFSNAYKYSREGGKIVVSLYTEDNNVILSVKDSGFGIPLNLQDMVFTKFFRANNIVDKEETGTGIGLYLTKILAENIDGEIWFSSREDKGSTFYFSMPEEGTLAKKGRFKLEKA